MAWRIIECVQRCECLNVMRGFFEHPIHFRITGAGMDYVTYGTVTTLFCRH